MKLASVLASAVLALFAVTVHAQQAAPQTQPTLQTPEARRSYAIGVQVAEGIKSQGVAVDPAMVAAGLRDALTGAKLLMTDEEIGAAMMVLQAEMKQKEELERAAMLEKNKKEGDEFLAANAKKEGVVSLAERPAVQDPDARSRPQSDR